MLSARQTFYILFPLVSFAVFAYPLLRLSNWYLGSSGLSLITAVTIWALATLAMWHSFNGPKKWVRYVMVHWMGASFILMSLTFLAEPVALIWVANQPLIAQGVVLLAIILIIGAVLASHHLAIKTIQIRNPKLSKPLRLVQISDVHIGSRQGGFMRRIVDKINLQGADIVVITGDLVDSSAVGELELASLQDIAAPTYFVIGNHERYADLDKILAIAQTFGLVTLQQQAAVLGEVQLVGIDDADRRDQVQIELPAVSLEDHKFNILLYHRPVGWAAARAGQMDLMLSGHTHNGQIFPFNFLVKRQFDRIKGLFEQDGAWLYVSSGAGTWGPLMRLGTRNEITVIDLLPSDIV